MSPEIVHALPFFATAGLLLGVLALGFASPRRAPGYAEYMAVIGAAATHTLGYGLELATPTLEGKLFFHRIVWLGLAAAPPASLLLALRFARKPASRGLLGALGASVVIIALLALTNDLHFALEGPPRLVQHGELLVRVQARGPAFWAYFVVASACACGSLAIYGAAWLSGPALQRRQARMLFFAVLAPTILNIVFVILATAVRYGPVALGVSALVIGWAFFRDGFLDLVPIAHETVFATIADPIFVLDRRGRIVDENPAARALAEGPLVSGAAADERFPFLAGATGAGPVELVRVGARALEMRTTRIAADGRVITLHDVTEREAQEAATKRALAARSEFIARMSHEVRTPLQGVLGALDLLDRAADADDAARHKATARRGVALLLTLVDDVLDLQRSGDGLHLRSDVVDLRAIVEEVMTAVEPTAILKGVTLEADTRAIESRLLEGDPQRIRQLLLNLAANAVKFTPCGAVRLVADTVNTADGCLVRLCVEDTGPGIPEADLPQVFDPFVQVDGSRTRRADGVGLGLSICRGIADAMGGQLGREARGEAPSGAVGERELPFAPAAASPTIATLDAAASAPEFSARVLLVEDHPVSRAVVTEMLESLGADVVAVAQGLEGLQAARAAHFDVALVDLHMPDMDGLAVVRSLRATAADTSIIVFTADVRPSVAQEARAAGAAELLVKPATSASLAEALARHAPPAPRLPAAPSPRDRLVALFASTYPAEVAQMRRALTEGDEGSCDELLHGLLGASALLGFTDVAALCDEGRGQLTLAQLARLERECERAVRPRCSSRPDDG